MIERKKYDFVPDYRHIVDAAWNRPAARLPLYEQHFGSQVIYDLTGLTPYEMMYSNDMKESREGFRQLWEFYRQMGFDAVCHDFWFNGILEGGGALAGVSEGCIRDRADFERYPWEDLPRRFFDRYTPYLRNLAETHTPGMKVVGGAGNGVFEAVQDVVGYVNLCYIKADDEELYYDLFRAMGRAIVQVWDRLMREFRDVYCVMRFCDDMGIKHQTLLNPADIRSSIIPVYRQITDIVHSYNRPFILHSCGDVSAVMDDLIDTARIDGKHSNEDVIMPFSDVVHAYGHRIGNFGGLDVGILATQSPETIRAMTFDCLEAIQNHGGIAFSSGSSVPDYIPAENYLAMNEAVRDFRAECLRAECLRAQ